MYFNNNITDIFSKHQYNKNMTLKLTTNPENFEVKHLSFPSIEQYRNVIRNVKDFTRYSGKDENGDAKFDASIPLPKIKYVGTIKLHGTNAGVVLYIKNGEVFVSYQSRERLLSITSDNSAFMFTQNQVFSKTENIEEILNNAGVSYNEDTTVQIFGEWCGKGIQAKVAISQLDKMFVIFAVKVNDKWLSRKDVAKFKLPQFRIFNIYDAPTYEVEIDFDQPELAQNKMIDITIDVETVCPFGNMFGVEGVGEGVVWGPGDTNDEKYNDSRFWFKVKGEKHQNSKVKTLAPVDVERVNSVSEFVDKVVTLPRLEQGLDKMREAGLELDRKNIPFFLKWVANDVFKEELDTLAESGLTPKDVGGAISNKAKKFFFEQEIV